MQQLEGNFTLQTGYFYQSELKSSPDVEKKLEDQSELVALQP